jgi:hypothetical protein
VSGEWLIDPFPKPGHMDVDEIVNGGVSSRLLPHITRQRLTRDNGPGATQEVFKQLELFGR